MRVQSDEQLICCTAHCRSRAMIIRRCCRVNARIGKHASHDVGAIADSFSDAQPTWCIASDALYTASSIIWLHLRCLIVLDSLAFSAKAQGCNGTKCRHRSWPASLSSLKGNCSCNRLHMQTSACNTSITSLREYYIRVSASALLNHATFGVPNSVPRSLE